MATTDDINVMLWQRLKSLSDAGTLPITGKVYNGERDLKAVSEDVTVKATLVTTPYEHTQRTDVNVNVFTDDIATGGNKYVPNDERLALLSKAVVDFIESIDYTFDTLEVTDYTETRLEEPALRQHYMNFLIRMNIYD